MKIVILIIAILLIQPFVLSAQSPTCSAGGCGATSCTYTIVAGWFSDTWTTSCGSGFYACCKFGSASCFAASLCGSNGGGGCAPVPGSENGETEC